MTSFVLRRKRGRPRRDEPREINDFDLALIQEFQQRPAFYDRTHPQYRNREFLEPQWIEISRNLGFNVSLVKNRMIQLRNRYNLEKRRVEALQEQYNDRDITSQWTLYDNLDFLGDHIKARRSFTKQILPIKTKEGPASNSSDMEDYEDSQQYGNENLIESDNQQQENNTDMVHMETVTTVANHNYNDNTHLQQATEQQQQQQQVERQQQLNHQIQQQHQNQHQQQQQLRVRNLLELNNCGVDKFRAFGQFLTSSLIEMNEKDALRLVEKFTSELVNSLLTEPMKSSKRFQQNENTNDISNLDM